MKIIEKIKDWWEEFIKPKAELTISFTDDKVKRMNGVKVFKCRYVFKDLTHAGIPESVSELFNWFNSNIDKPYFFQYDKEVYLLKRLEIKDIDYRRIK